MSQLDLFSAPVSPLVPEPGPLPHLSCVQCGRKTWAAPIRLLEQGPLLAVCWVCRRWGPRA